MTSEPGGTCMPSGTTAPAATTLPVPMRTSLSRMLPIPMRQSSSTMQACRMTRCPALIGARVGVGHRVILHACIVEDDCLIGMGSILLNDVRIGTGSVVAAGAVVPEGMQVPPGSLVMGVPARVVRHVDDGLRARIRGTWEHYVGEAERHRSGAFPVQGAGGT